MQRDCPALIKTVGVCLFLCLLLCTRSVTAQNLPNFTSVAGTQLTSTGGQWVTVNPAQPNNIDLVESRIFKMPQHKTGVVGIEFKLEGADGGTARYQSGAFNNLSKGGGGGQVQFTLPLQNTDNYGKPFLVTFGKKGESKTIHQGYYVSAGGGGSTGMSWLAPNATHYSLNNTKANGPNAASSKNLIAAAGGGSGGFSYVYGKLHGNSATGNATTQSGNNWLENTFSSSLYMYFNLNGDEVLWLASGGSTLSYTTIIPHTTCCSNDDKLYITSSYAYNQFDYTFLGGELTSVTHGQKGGQPVAVFLSENGNTNSTGMGVFSVFSVFSVTSLGGKGGAGLGGGGAGGSTTSATDLASSPNGKPSGGAGGTGSSDFSSSANTYPFAGDAGWNNYATYINGTVGSRAQTENPQSGKLMYRTIMDTEVPVINQGSTVITLNVGNGLPSPDYSPNAPLTMAMLAPYIGAGNVISDNDGIQSISFYPTQLSCSDVGHTISLYISVTDFAGNSHGKNIDVNVTDTFSPVKRYQFEPSPNPLDPGLPFRIDVSNGPVTLTAANFPEAYDGCNGSNVTVNFPPTLFNCSQADIPQTITFSYSDNDGHQSPQYTKTFNIVCNRAPVESDYDIYVDHTATGVNNGTSWANAFTSLQNALNSGASKSRIYVAKGTYYPDKGNGITQNERNATFKISQDFKLYGGFPNGGGSFESRNPETNPTILSGEINNTATVSDNSYHVVSISSNNIHIEGFTIRDGYADDNSILGGGGLFIAQTGNLATDSHITVRDCKLLNNFGYNGGAVYVRYANSATSNYLDFQNCLFQNNTAVEYAGALFESFFPAIPNLKQSFVGCAFNNNRAKYGGALSLETNTQNNLTNCTFSYNNASAIGGAIRNNGSMVVLHNSILYFNTSPSGAQIADNNNVQIDYSNIQGSGGSAGWVLPGVQDLGHNIDADPLFNASQLSITEASPSRNAGLNSYNTETFDIYGQNPRVNQDVIDMGAFEINSVVFVAADAPAGGNGNSWTTAFNNLSAGIQAAGTGQWQKDVWVKEGTYRPDRVPGSNTVTENNRDNSFYLNYTLKIYGGFAGDETSVLERNTGQHPTILSGDIGVAGTLADNTYHVVTMQSGATRLDGFIIEAGYAFHASDPDRQRGAGLYEYASLGGANNVVANCVFRINQAADKGGAVYTQVSQSGVSNFVQCLFYANTAPRGASAFVQMTNTNNGGYDQNYYNVTALGNTSGLAAFEAAEASGKQVNINFYNSLLVGNTPQNYNDTGNPGHIILANTYSAASSTGIFENTSSIAGADGKIMTADDGLRLPLSSPAINYGNNALIYSGVDKDIAGNQRIVKDVVDVGAYESPYPPIVPDGNGIIYVKKNATGKGTSWADATGDLHHAIMGVGVQKVFVAIGNYPVGDNSFIMKNGVAIYGGFDPDNGIADLSQKRIMPDPANYVNGSVLDGENARPVIWNVFTSSTALNNTAVLDGFMITNGAYSNGAGIRNVYASPMLSNLMVRENIATITGAGIHNENSSPVIFNTLINRNTIVLPFTQNGTGAGIYNGANSAPTIVNATITNNQIKGIGANPVMVGAGIGNLGGSNPKIYNSIIWDNQKIAVTVAEDSDIENNSASVTLKNSITQTYNTGNPDDNNKVGSNPLFTGADFKLQSNSPAVNTGNNSWFTFSGNADLAGNLRVLGSAIDMGAYEYQCLPVDDSHVTFADVVHDYDGNPHTVAVQNVPPGVSVTYAITDAANQTIVGNTATNAGIYTIRATMTVTGENCSSVLSRTTTLTIRKVQAVITADDVQDHVYDGAIKNVTASLNHTETELDYSPQQGYTNTGAYTVTVSAPETANYFSASKEVMLSIENADFAGITLNDGSFTSDGTPKSLAITGALPPGATVVYGGNEKADIGTYTVVALVQRPNYNDLWLTAEMTISSTLPVRWISFTARLSDDNHGVLDWKVDQSSVSDYEIERSSNARDFRAIGTVTAGNSEGIAEYNFTDPMAATGTVYYRIKQTDLDGTYAYSRIVSVKGFKGVQLTAYPNPVSQNVTVQFSADYIGTSLKLINTLGIVLQQPKVTSERLNLNLDGYPTGVYLLYTWDGRTVKLIKN